MKKLGKILLKILKWILILLVLIIVLFFAVRFVGQTINRQTPEGGINETRYVDINGDSQWISIYGQSTENPVLLYLHGGPGSQTSDLDYPVLRKLSDIYTVVDWDQRACGLSWRPEQWGTQVTYEELYSDAVAMTEYLRKEFGRDKISVMGISFGAALGANLVLDHPEYYEELFALSLPVDQLEIQRAFKEAALEWTKDDPELREVAERIITEQAQYDSMTLAEQLDAITDQGQINTKYVEANSLSGADVNIIATYIFNPYYSLKDFYNGFYASQPKSVEEYEDYNYYSAVVGLRAEGYKSSVLNRTDYDVPVYIIMGDSDYTVMTPVAKAYYEKINAPRKEYFEVEGGHYMPMLRTEELSAIVHAIAEEN